MRYQILQDGEVLGVISAKSSSEAIDEFCERHMPAYANSVGYSARDFLRYSLKVRRLPPRYVEAPPYRFRFEMRHWIWTTIWIAIAIKLFPRTIDYISTYFAELLFLPD